MRSSLPCAHTTRRGDAGEGVGCTRLAQLERRVEQRLDEAVLGAAHVENEPSDAEALAHLGQFGRPRRAERRARLARARLVLADQLVGALEQLDRLGGIVGI